MGAVIARCGGGGPCVCEGRTLWRNVCPGDHARLRKACCREAMIARPEATRPKPVCHARIVGRCPADGALRLCRLPDRRARSQEKGAENTVRATPTTGRTGTPTGSEAVAFQAVPYGQTPQKCRSLADGRCIVAGTSELTDRLPSRWRLYAGEAIPIPTLRQWPIHSKYLQKVMPSERDKQARC